MATFIGVDAGGTATRAVLTNAKGDVLDLVNGDAANPHIHGLSVSIRTLTSVLTALLGDKSYESCPNDSVYKTLESVVVALSGADEVSVITEYTTRLRVAFRLPPHVMLHVVHDSAAPAGLLLGSTNVSLKNALRSGNPPRGVCVLISGTGSVSSVFELHAKGDLEGSEHVNTSSILTQGANTLLASTRAGGRGPLIGDGGSAYAIATGTLRRAMRICDSIEDSSGKPSLRSDAHEVLALAARMFNVSPDVSVTTEEGLASLAAAVHRTHITRGKIASLAQSLADAASDGNSIASDAFAIAADDLAHLVIAVVGRTQDATVVGTGGVFNAWDKVSKFRETFLRVLSEKCSTVRNLWLVQNKSTCAAAIGAARLGALLHGKDDIQWAETAWKELRPIFLKK